MAQDKENFLGRWSRLKREDEKALPQKKEEGAGEAPVLPPVDELTPESDFKGFMHPKVDQALRRAALKKLFSDPHFNIPDPYEPYSGDWTVGEPISDELMQTLNQARTHLFSGQPKEEEPSEEKPTETAELPEQDEPGRKDA